MAAPSYGGLHIAMVAWVVAVSRVDTDGPPEAEADGHPMAQHPGTRQRHPHLARLPPGHPGATPHGRTPDGASPTASGISDGASAVKDLDLLVDGV